jgi:hypothetical protein
MERTYGTLKSFTSKFPPTNWGATKLTVPIGTFNFNNVYF